MNEVVTRDLSSLRFGGRQVFEGLTVFPVFDGRAAGPSYLTLSQALAEGYLTVTEVSEGGEVPTLRVANAGRLPVLLLDGEELAGAKQNRVLNTTVLVAPESVTVIPVSCTEAGRWSYVSDRFVDSGYVAAAPVRRKKSASVAVSLECRGEFRSDQHEVWRSIDEMALLAEAPSPTHALRDVFRAKTARLEQYERAFPCLPGQKGLLVGLGPTLLGIDVVSKPTAYASLHGKLVKSYAIEAIVEDPPVAGPPSVDAARRFVACVREADERAYPSVGLGTDYRYRGEDLFASALVHEEAVVHFAAFRAEVGEEGEEGSSMSGFRRRRSFLSE